MIYNTVKNVNCERGRWKGNTEVRKLLKSEFTTLWQGRTCFWYIKKKHKIKNILAVPILEFYGTELIIFRSKKILSKVVMRSTSNNCNVLLFIPKAWHLQKKVYEVACYNF